MRAPDEAAPARPATARSPATERSPPIMKSVHGAATRKPVFSGNRRVAGLYERILADGSTVYDVALRLGGKVQRHRLAAQTKTDAIAELRALQVDYERGEQ